MHGDLVSRILKKIRNVKSFDISGRKISIHEAALTGNLETIEEIIRKNNDKALDVINEKDRKGYTPIHYACISSNLECIKALITLKANVNEQAQNHQGTLHFAALSGSIDALKYLLESCNMIDHLDFYDVRGYLPIHFAVRSGKWSTIEFLESYDRHQLSKTTNNGMNVMHIAAEKGHLDLTKKLLAGWDFNMKFPPDADGNTLLHFSAFSGNCELYRYVEKYYETHHIQVTRNIHGHLPIFEASVSKNIELIKYIVEKEPNSLQERSVTNNTPLFCTATSGALDCVKFVLENVSYTDECDLKGRNIFHHAATSGSIEVVEYLFDTLPNSVQLISALSAQTKQSVIQFSIASRGGLECGLLEWLLSSEKTSQLMIPLIPHIDKDEHSLLHSSCASGNLGALKYLMENHRLCFDIQKDLERKSYLEIAAELRYLDIVQYLIHLNDVSQAREVHHSILHRLGYCQNEELFNEIIQRLDIDVNEEDPKGTSALHVAAQLGNYAGFRGLCNLNANVNNVSIEGVTLLHSASYGGNLEIVKELVIKHKFNLNEPISRGDQSTALHFATANLNKDIIEFLVDHNANVNATTVHRVSILHEACRNETNVYLKKQKDIVEYLLRAGAWKSLRVEATCGKGNKQTPYDMASNNSICKVLAAHDPSFSTDHNLVPYSLISEFCIEENILGSGHFGSVYRGNLFGTTVAIKLLKSQTCDVEYRFRIEVGIMAMIRHPNVCMLMGACVENNTFCLVMEYIPITLESLLPTLTMQDIIHYALDISMGMAWLHTREPMVLHCDLKSDNILIDNGRAKVSDFGLSTLFDPQSRAMMMEQKDREIHQAITAPEVAQQLKFSIRSDIYSFGCCLFLMFWKGKHAFALDTVRLLPDAQDTEKNSIIVSMMLKSCSYFPESRYSSFQEIIEILEALKANADLIVREERIQAKILEDDELAANDCDPFAFSLATNNGSYIPM